MREILFKAKRLSDGEWVEGFPYWGEYSGAFILQNKAYRRRNARTGEILMGDDIVPIEVDPSTVCEYTGLTDKNGKKIFEGDVVRVKYRDCGEDQKEITTVNWNSEDVSFSPWNWEYVCDGCDCSCELESIEVIGSIHDGEGDDDD